MSYRHPSAAPFVTADVPDRKERLIYAAGRWGAREKNFGLLETRARARTEQRPRRIGSRRGQGPERLRALKPRKIEFVGEVEREEARRDCRAGTRVSGHVPMGELSPWRSRGTYGWRDRRRHADPGGLRYDLRWSLRDDGQFPPTRQRPSRPQTRDAIVGRWPPQRRDHCRRMARSARAGDRCAAASKPPKLAAVSS